MKKTSLLAAFAAAALCILAHPGSLLARVARATTVTEDEAEVVNEIPLRPSQGETAQITILVIVSLLLTRHENAADCKLALEDSIDQQHYFTKNQTAATSGGSWT